MSNARHLDMLFSVGTSTGLPDDELLERFLERRDQADRASSAAEAAFEAIVRRHGPMVLGVCRRYLGDPNDVEDAFQATFIVLFRRAGSVRVGKSLGPWLHGVSRRIAARARARTLRRKAREAGYGIEPATDPSAEECRREASEALDEELGRLPSRYRMPIILCHLEGLTYQEAAHRLGCPVGTVGVRLSRGRELLKARLNRRGSILPAGPWAADAPLGAAPTPLPPQLVDATVAAVIRGMGGRAMRTGLVSASAMSLSEGFLRARFMTGVTIAALVVLSAGLTVTGGLLLRQAQAKPGGGQASNSRNVVTQGVEAPDARRSPGTSVRTQRVRELIYFFRDYRVFSRDEEWARTIRELAAIGKDAVPELVAELDRTDRDATIRSLAFTLRAIGDPRAVPALIRAIPKALRPPGSDCGVNIVDPDLRAFMQAHQNHKAEYVAIGRPVNEIITAIERITKHREPPDVGDRDPLRHAFLGGTPEEQARQRAMFEQRRNLWEAWWSHHWREFVTPEELRSVELPRRDQDLVAMAGLARYGPLFPTGPGVRLGPVRMLRLTQTAYANGRSHLDFDTGKVFSQYEGMKASDWGRPDEFGPRINAWFRRSGIDAYCQGPVDGVDLLLWLVDDSRWDTLEAEIRKGGPLPLGREATSNMVRFEKTWVDFQPDKLATFLFTTREGGRGIVQVFPRDKHVDGYRLRYRMWSTSTDEPTGARPLAGPRRAGEPGTPFGKIVTTTLGSPAGERESLLDFEADRRAVPPQELKPANMAAASSLPHNRSFTRWCRDQGIDVFGFVVPAEREVEAARGPAPAKAVGQPMSQSVSGLIGLDMIGTRILPETFDEVTVEEAREILGRMPADRSGVAWMMIGDDLAERPDTFAFRTRDGVVGLLQIEAGGKEEKLLTIRYRLEPRH
jgi:RNA polymerase sigma factor (sigma-70 family)